ncbi:hypothetical protein RHOSPDRAFT_34837 [Rhodotorula sp. JG-1b]|nr:hypothetical protein RHOSPDRAFT_34837 [Rhodotorula sp. JG-1b]
MSVTPPTATFQASRPDKTSDSVTQRRQTSEAEPPVASDTLRRNTLSDLRIPLRIAAKQKKIQEDLDRVKQFAMAIEELKALRIRYDAIKSDLSEPAFCWEQAQAVINLADGAMIEEPEAGILAGIDREPGRSSARNAAPSFGRVRREEGRFVAHSSSFCFSAYTRSFD